MSTLTERPVQPAVRGPKTRSVKRPTGSSPRTRDVIKAYVALTKPRIVELLLVTTVPTMMLAANGLPSLWLMAAVLAGGSLAAGGASALNCYIDRDIDQVMRRTKRRPLPAHSVSPRNALWFGLALSALSVAIMALTTNWLATAMTLGSIVYYDVVYTLWLKRVTAWNTFWGGICGSAPVLIGWAAVTGSLSPVAWALFAVVFFWQMPHFYALAIKYKDDYARAGIPMLPVVASVRRVNVEIVGFAWLTLISSLAAWPFGLSWIYGVPATVVGALFVLESHLLARRASKGEPVKPMRLFHWSTTYLTIVFLAVAIDALV